MQNVSAAYKKAMRQPFRNRGYITARIGIISSTAQDNVVAKESDNDFAYFANNTDVFKDNTVSRVYATMEQDFTKVDGTMYFLPEEYEGYDYYNNGLVTNELLSPVYISFDGNIADIKGLTIDFGEYYPTSFTVQSDNGTKTYENSGKIFVTEDTFDAVTFLRITPVTMVNGQGRMRIFQFTCGISNTFSNKQVKSFTYKDYVSSVCESLPSQDMTLTVDNQDLYYNPDNPESAVAYMEQGQEMKVSFGYDLDGEGTIEWVPEITTFLKSWSATDTEAKFTMVDVFDWKLNGTYYKGLYRTEGISLYDLALDVLTDAGMNSEEYVIDPYLHDVKVYNPMPAVKYSEALQIISNAGRCVLSVDRKGRVLIRSSFIPDMTSSAGIDLLYPSNLLYPGDDVLPIGDNGTATQTGFSHAENVLKSGERTAYAMFSNDFSVVDGTVMFLPESESDYVDTTGYVSDSIADENGEFEDIPKIIIKLESGYICYGFAIQFRNVAPKEYHVVTYYQEEQVQDVTVENPGLYSQYTEQLDRFDVMEIVFKKGYPNARVAVDSVLFGNATDYTLSRDYNLKGSPTATRQERVKTIAVKRSLYRNSTLAIKELSSEELTLAGTEITKTIHFSKASYGLTVSVEEGNATAAITASSNYFADIKITGAAGEKIRYSVKGYEYVVDELYYRVNHNDTGIEKAWSNPLISTEELAKDQEEWLASYYLGDVDYQISWNGDPRTDANDLFYLELKGRDKTMIRAYQNELKYSSGWSGTLKARKVVL